MNEQNVARAKLAMLGMQRFSWEQGTACQALLELGDTDAMISLAWEAVHRQIEDGRACIMGDAHGVTDPCAVGEALLKAAELTGDRYFSDAADRLLDWALHKAPRNEDGIVYHITGAPEMWVDSFYMLPPFLAAAGQYEEAVKQIEGYWNLLFSREAGLLSHIWDDGAKQFKRKAYWGSGNGWALAGMSRVINALPSKMKAEQAGLVQKIQTLLDSSLPYQRPDGLFHDVVDEPDTFPEVNYPQMMAYTIFRGVKAGWLDRKYLPAAEKIRGAVQHKVDRYGVVHEVCGAPHFDKSGYSVEGQAFYLLMEAAARDSK